MAQARFPAASALEVRADVDVGVVSDAPDAVRDAVRHAVGG